MKSNASANLFLDTRTTTKENQHPVKLRICHLRKQWAVGLKVYLTPGDYDKVMLEGGKKTSEQKEIRDLLMDYKQKAEKVLESLKVITPDNFKRMFLSEADIVTAASMIDIRSQFRIYIDELRDENRFRSADFYNSALKTFTEFKGNVNLQEIDTNYLRRYEIWMMSKGRSRATVMMYCRALRAIFNRCFKAGILSRKFYPFIDFSVASSKKSKHVLYPEQVKALIEFECQTEAQQRAKDYWLASYMSNGMNISNNLMNF
jgi:integrase/recombinase XerD